MTFKHKLSARLALMRDHVGPPALALLLSAVAACSGGDLFSGGDTPPGIDPGSPDAPPGTPSSASSFVMSPKVAKLETGKAIALRAFDARGEGDSVPLDVTWHVSGGVLKDTSDVWGEVAVFRATTRGEYIVTAKHQPTGRVDSATIVVAPKGEMIKHLQLFPAAVAIGLSASQQFTVEARTEKGTTASVNASFSTTGGTITPNGLFSAGRTPGTYKIIASAAGLADTATVTVAGATDSGAEGGTDGGATDNVAPTASVIPLKVRRFDGRSGVVTVSNGIPLPPGKVKPGDVGNVRVFVNGQEQRIYVEALHGRHRDGSLRSILVQFEYPIDNALGIPAELRFGSRRGTPDIARTTPSAQPRAVALPSSPEYLVSTLVGGQLSPATRAAPLGSLIAAHDADYAYFGDAIWGKIGPSLGRGTAFYEHVLTAYQYWLRTADSKWFERALAIAVNYRDYVLARQVTAPWVANSEGLAVHYFVTGDTRTWEAVGRLAEGAASQTFRSVSSTSSVNRYWIGGSLGDDRMRGRSLMASIDGYLVNAAPGRWYNSRLPAQNVTDILNSQKPDGRFGGSQYLDGQKNFMVGMLLTALIRYYDEVEPDPRIPPAVKRAIDYMWSTQWVPSAQGFKYISVENVPREPRGTHPEPGLNGLIMPAFGWYHNYSGDPRYKVMGEQMLAGLRKERANWVGFAKQFDQAYYRVFDYFQDVR